MDLYYSTILIHWLILSNDCFNILCIICSKYSNGRIMSHSLIYYLNDVYALCSYCYFIYHWRLEISIIFSLQTFMIISNVLFFEYNINRRQLSNLNYVLVQGSFFFNDQSYYLFNVNNNMSFSRQMHCNEMSPIQYQ